MSSTSSAELTCSDAYLRRRLSTFDSQGLRRTESGGALAHRPFRIHPDTLKEGPWMREEDRATELLSLFFGAG